MENSDFWAQIQNIIDDGFSPEGLEKLDRYAELFINGKLRFERFLPQEQHGCSEGGLIHVIATILAGAETRPDSETEGLSQLKRELKLAETQSRLIETWARKSSIWIDSTEDALSKALGPKIAEGGEAKVYDNGPTLIKTIGLDYFIYPRIAFDRISLHNAYFPETALEVIGYGRDAAGRFEVIAKQSFIQGVRMDNIEIQKHMEKIGFSLKNPSNWTYSNSEVYVSDLHDENVIMSKQGNVFIIDCDIRLNTPELKCGGHRTDTNEVIS